MKAMILAAGRGQRMQPLTDEIPKALLTIAGKPLLAHHLIKLHAAGIKEIVINISHFAEKIQAAVGDGSDYGVKIYYSIEPIALETGGGIYQALPHLGNDAFLVMSTDIWTEYPLHQLIQHRLDNHFAHLVMTDNPTYHPEGDFALRDGKLKLQTEPKLTYASFGLLHPDLFKNCRARSFRLTEVLLPAIEQEKISGEYYNGCWENIGTIEDWEKLKSKYPGNPLK